MCCGFGHLSLLAPLMRQPPTIQHWGVANKQAHHKCNLRCLLQSVCPWFTSLLSVFSFLRHGSAIPPGTSTFLLVNARSRVSFFPPFASIILYCSSYCCSDKINTNVLVREMDVRNTICPFRLCISRRANVERVLQAAHYFMHFAVASFGWKS